MRMLKGLSSPGHEFDVVFFDFECTAITVSGLVVHLKVERHFADFFPFLKVW